MKISDLEFEMELAGVDKADIADILKPYTNKNINTNLIDDALEKLGYPRVLEIAFSEYDDEEEDEWGDSFMNVEKFPHKHRYEA
jgi:hypothetical protein